MKKVLIVVLAVVLTLALGACGGVQSQLIKYSNYYYQADEYTRYQLAFEKGKLTLTYQEYREDSSSPTGKSLKSSDEKTYDYKVISDTQIEVDGTVYTFEFYKKNTKNDARGLRFDAKFLDISSEW